MHRVDPRQFLEAKTIDEQRAIFETKFAPFFDRKFIRWVTDQRSSLFGLGIPLAQYDALADGKPMADVLRGRLEKLTCDFPLEDNYFAWQALWSRLWKGCGGVAAALFAGGPLMPRSGRVPGGSRCCTRT